jgi:hypothetical protein
MDPRLITYKQLVRMLKEEMWFNIDRDMLYYYAPGESRGDMEFLRRRQRVVHSNLSLRSAIRVLRTHGGSVLPFYLGFRPQEEEIEEQAEN